MTGDKIIYKLKKRFFLTYHESIRYKLAELMDVLGIRDQFSRDQDYNVWAVPACLPIDMGN